MVANIKVMVNGLPGNMGREIAEACSRRGVKVANIALTGPGMPGSFKFSEEYGGGGEETEQKVKDAMAAASSDGDILIAIDFTHPTAVNPNADLYCKLSLPFVMGTTGGDRGLLMHVVKTSGNYALIAPNMCKQIVAFQAMMDKISNEYPGAFGGYSLSVTESHQSGKADTSGTAKEIVKHLNKLKGGPEFPVDDIVKLRDEPEQVAFGVPKEALAGHAWHTYTLKSSDGSVIFEFKHNVCGRRTYAEGVVDAVKFLGAKIDAKADTKIYDMIDVLRSGAMVD